MRKTSREDAPPTMVATIGLDIAKSVFQVHGADVAGAKLFNRRLARDQVLEFFSSQPRCQIAMEACASSHYWAREIAAIGHDVRIIPVKYVAPLVKRQKNDAADAAAICEAAQRPGMRFVPVKSAERQGSGVLFRTRVLIIRQRAQMVNALRGHLAEFGSVAPRGLNAVVNMSEVACHEHATPLPEAALMMLRMMMRIVKQLSQSIAEIDAEIVKRVREDGIARRLTTIPGIGPLIATAITALAPPMETFSRGRDFAAWVGLTPRQNSTGGKIRLGPISKMGNGVLRNLLFLGALSIVLRAKRQGDERSWVKSMLARKPHKLVCVATANKMARIVWAVTTTQKEYIPSAALGGKLSVA